MSRARKPLLLFNGGPVFYDKRVQLLLKRWSRAIGYGPLFAAFNSVDSLARGLGREADAEFAKQYRNHPKLACELLVVVTDAMESLATTKRGAVVLAAQMDRTQFALRQYGRLSRGLMEHKEVADRAAVLMGGGVEISPGMVRKWLAAEVKRRARIDAGWRRRSVVLPKY